jgi:hypothetical protein
MTLQRKKPAKRFFPCLVGLPPEAEPATPVSVALIESTPLPVYQSTQDILDGIERQKRDKRNEADRKRREEKKKQRARIKEALRTPVSELKRIIEENRAKAKEQAEIDKASKSESRDNDGSCLTDAPRGLGRLVTGTNIELVAAAHARAVELGSSDIDVETGEAFWPDNDRRYVKPDGVGQAAGQESQDEKKIAFKVDPHIDHEQKLKWGQALIDLFHALFVEVSPDEEHGGYFICRLCRIVSPSERGCSRHLETVHGGETEPGHDPRFGNVVKDWIRGFKKA